MTLSTSNETTTANAMRMTMTPDKMGSDPRKAFSWNPKAAKVVTNKNPAGQAVYRMSRRWRNNQHEATKRQRAATS
jgi:hypothetical protein